MYRTAQTLWNAISNRLPISQLLGGQHADQLIMRMERRYWLSPMVVLLRQEMAFPITLPDMANRPTCCSNYVGHSCGKYDHSRNRWWSDCVLPASATGHCGCEDTRPHSDDRSTPDPAPSRVISIAVRYVSLDCEQTVVRVVSFSGSRWLAVILISGPHVSDSQRLTPALD